MTGELWITSPKSTKLYDVHDIPESLASTNANGDINGDLDASTGSGTIRATGIRGGLRMHTGSGGIQVQGEQMAQWELGTGSGRIDIDLPPNAGFEFTGHTGSGGIDVGYPMTVQGRISGNRHDVAGKVGAGGYRLVARTGSGHIRIQ